MITAIAAANAIRIASTAPVTTAMPALARPANSRRTGLGGAYVSAGNRSTAIPDAPDPRAPRRVRGRRLAG